MPSRSVGERPAKIVMIQARHDKVIKMFVFNINNPMSTNIRMEFEMLLLQIMCLFIGLLNCNSLPLVLKSEDKICPELNLPHGEATPLISAVAPVYRFKCEDGFQLYGADKSSCTERGVWYPAIPKCIKSGCKKPNLVNGKGQYIKPNLHKNALISFTCNNGFRRNGPDRLLCDGRTWNDQPPTCVSFKPEKDPVECDFEDVYLCGWSQDINDDFDWTRWSGKTHTNDTGPDTDYTTGTDRGHYLFVESSSPQRAGDKANLISMIFPPKYATKKCLTFRYHMYGKDVGKLSVFLTPANMDTSNMNDSHQVFNVTRNRSNEWHLGNVSLPNQKTAFKIVIQGMSGGSTGDIALDDVKISKCIEGKILTTEMNESSQTLNMIDNSSSQNLNMIDNSSSHTLNMSDNSISQILNMIDNSSSHILNMSDNSISQTLNMIDNSSSHILSMRDNSSYQTSKMRDSSSRQTFNLSNNFSYQTNKMDDNAKYQTRKIGNISSATQTNNSSTEELLESSHFHIKNKVDANLGMVYTETLAENSRGKNDFKNETNEENSSMKFQSVQKYNNMKDTILRNETTENEITKQFSNSENATVENHTISPEVVGDNDITLIDNMVNASEQKVEFPNETVDVSRDSQDSKYPNQDTFHIKAHRVMDNWILTEDSVNMSIKHDVTMETPKVTVGAMMENNINNSERSIDEISLNLNLNNSQLLSYTMKIINSEDYDTLVYSENNKNSTSVNVKEEQNGNFNLSKDVPKSQPNQVIPKIKFSNNYSVVNITTGEMYNSLNENGNRNETYNNDILNISTTELAKMQHEDSDLVRVFRWISQRQKPPFETIRGENPGLRNLWLNFELIKIVDGVLCKSRFQLGPRNETVKILLPRSLVKTVLENMWKTESSFVDVTKVFERITASYSWYRIQDDIKLFQLNCTKYQTTKHTFNNYPTNSTDLIYGSPMVKICLRFLGPFSLRETGSRFIFLITDAYSLMTQIYILSNDSLETIVRSLTSNYFSIVGTPLHIHYDQSSPPQRALFSNLSLLLELKQVDKCTCDKQRHAMTEKYVHILIQTMSELIVDYHSNWDELLFLLISSFNSHPMPDTGLSPNHLMFGRDHHRPVHVALVDSMHPTSKIFKHIYQYYVLRLEEKLDEVVEI